MKAETCSCCVILIKHIVNNKVVLDYKITYLLIIENTTGMPHDASPENSPLLKYI
jgi:hypothetical protein